MNMSSLHRFSTPKMIVTQKPIDSLIENNTSINSFPILAVHLFIPVSENLTETLGDELISAENVYFIIKQMTLSSLIEISFLNQFSKTGSLHAFTYKAKVEEETFIAFLPSGQLVLYLEREIAESLALQKERPPGLKKKKKRQRQSFQTCIIDTKSLDFSPGKKLYDTVLSELNKLNDFKFDLLLKWKPKGNICPQSITSYFEKVGYECVTCEPHNTTHIKYSVCMPDDLNLKQFNSDQAEDLMEWIGSHICGISLDPKDSELGNHSVMSTISSNVLDKLKMDFYEGFFDGDHICSLLKEARNLFEKNPKLPFIVISVNGYQESYIALKKFKKFSSGDKCITIVITSELKCWTITYEGR